MLKSVVLLCVIVLMMMTIATPTTSYNRRVFVAAQGSPSTPASTTSTVTTIAPSPDKPLNFSSVHDCDSQYLPTPITLPQPLYLFFLTVLVSNLFQYVIWPLSRTRVESCISSFKKKCCCSCCNDEDKERMNGSQEERREAEIRINHGEGRLGSPRQADAHEETRLLNDNAQEEQASPFYDYEGTNDQDTLFNNVWVHWFRLGLFGASCYSAITSVDKISEGYNVKYTSGFQEFAAVGLVIFNNNATGVLSGLIFGQHLQPHVDIWWMYHMKQLIRLLAFIGSIPIVFIYLLSVFPMLFTYCWVVVPLFVLAYLAVALVFTKEEMSLISEFSMRVFGFCFTRSPVEDCPSQCFGGFLRLMGYSLGSFYYFISFQGAMKRVGDRMVEKALAEGDTSQLFYAFISASICDVFSNLVFQWMANFAWMYFGLTDTPSYLHVFHADYAARSTSCYFLFHFDELKSTAVGSYNRIVQLLSML